MIGKVQGTFQACDLGTQVLSGHGLCSEYSIKANLHSEPCPIEPGAWDFGEILGELRPLNSLINM